MLHSKPKIWIHLVWTTKKRVKVFNPELSPVLHRFLMDKAKEIEVPFVQLNIQPEHIHGLINLPSNKSLADFMQQIKGSSSFYLNKSILKTKFEWQRGYGAFSVSASILPIVKNYIKNQESHHKKKSFSEEYDERINTYKIKPA